MKVFIFLFWKGGTNWGPRQFGVDHSWQLPVSTRQCLIPYPTDTVSLNTNTLHGVIFLSRKTNGFYNLKCQAFQD